MANKRVDVCFVYDVNMTESPFIGSLNAIGMYLGRFTVKKKQTLLQ